MLTQLKRLWTEDSGQGMVEYGLILALVAIVAVVALTSIGDTVKETFGDIVKGLNGELDGQTP